MTAAWDSRAARSSFRLIPLAFFRTYPCTILTATAWRWFARVRYNRSCSIHWLVLDHVLSNLSFPFPRTWNHQGPQQANPASP
ncbi:hypothetical protein QBC36DRAFT_302595 [Triangularia setosa]|uniref:Uncharacterized protein n=1 Tax=Triangularia setosa TaxID=2587417 RepID=A0AAN6W5S9_9PEZI|nr:hypothetical protein QBC36DRAFT_302595 [Podospora setosa]